MINDLEGHHVLDVVEGHEDNAAKIPEMNKVNRMLKRHLKATARGFRNFGNYRIRILFFCGKLTLSP